MAKRRTGEIVQAGDARAPGRIRSALIDWLGKPIGLTTGDFWREWYGSQTASGRNVSPESAMRLTAVWACIRLLAETISTLPLKVYQRNDDGSRSEATNNPLYGLLAVSPNSEMTPSRFMSFVVASLCLMGNAYIEKQRIGTRIVALNPLRPQWVTVRRNEINALEYVYIETNTLPGGQLQTFPPRVISAADMMHIRGFGLDGVMGLHPVYTGREVLGSAEAVEEAAAKVFAQGMQASGFLTSEAGILKPAQREQLKSALTQFTGSKNAGKVMVLEAGLKYQGITMNPEAAQMLETRAFSTEQICSWWRVPPYMIGHMDKQSSWAASVEVQNLHFLTTCLVPILTNIEQEISRCLVPPAQRRTVFASFSVEGLLRADSAGRASFYGTMVNNGIYSRNDVRRLENLPPIPGGDIYTVQSALTSIENVGKTPEAAPDTPADPENADNNAPDSPEAARIRQQMKDWLQKLEQGSAA